MKRLQFAAATAAIAVGLSLASAATADEPADGWVFDAMTAPSTVSYTGTVEAVGIGNQRSVASIYRIEHRAPHLTERRYMSPPSLRGDWIVSRGVESYLVDVRRRRVVEDQNEAADDQIARDDNYILLRANYRAVKQSVESFDGQPVRTVALVNKYTNRTTMLVRIDERTKLVLDKQQFSADGSMVSEVRFDDVRYTDAIPSGDFDIPKEFAMVRGQTFDEPSKDVERVVRSAGFGARAPTFLPDGFSPVEGRTTEMHSVPTLHVLYSDGLRTVSLFENAGPSRVDIWRLHPQPTKVAGRDALYADDGPTTLLAWTDGGLHCALVGELSLQELQRIASSLTR